MEPETYSQLKDWPKKIDEIRAAMTGLPILVTEVAYPSSAPNSTPW
ncbi:MAG: hypothetical protein ACREIC_03615 [Limisphaerales bacterium]